MLDNGGPFVLSSDTLNIIEGGDLNIFGRSQQQSSSTHVTQSTLKQPAAGPSGGEVKKTEMKLVQHARSHGKCTCFCFDLLTCYQSCPGWPQHRENRKFGSYFLVALAFQAEGLILSLWRVCLWTFRR